MKIYHEGFLARDRLHDAALNKKANAIWKRGEGRKIHLLQRRVGFCKWVYFYVEARGNGK
tara:strand:- start:183 stop:362 length:180 start_codon:yes stop_codon:yes gene_type:complete